MVGEGTLSWEPYGIQIDESTPAFKAFYAVLTVWGSGEDLHFTAKIRWSGEEQTLIQFLAGYEVETCRTTPQKTQRYTGVVQALPPPPSAVQINSDLWTEWLNTIVLLDLLTVITKLKSRIALWLHYTDEGLALRSGSKGISSIRVWHLVRQGYAVVAPKSKNHTGIIFKIRWVRWKKMLGSKWI